MRREVERQCDQHPDRFDCPDCLVAYSPRFREYGLIIHDGGGSVMRIRFCPWCGTVLPGSLVDRWFEKLDSLGFDDPFVQDIPQRYQSDAWCRETSG
jgi:hypothetical protein